MRRWVVVIAWFFVQFTWNLLTKSYDHERGAIYSALVAVGWMTAPIQLFVSAIVLFIIRKQPWNRKPLAQRMQEKSDEPA